MNTRALDERFREMLQRGKKPSGASPTNRASSIAHPCTRHLVLERTQGDKKPEVSDELEAIFRDGDMHEDDVKAKLTKMGLKIYGSGRAFPPNAYNLTGHVDCYLERAPEWLDEFRRALILEIKSLNPYDAGSLRACPEEERAEWVKNHHWIRKWYGQGQTYSFLGDCAGVLFVFKDKGTGWLIFVWCPLDLEYVQGVLDRAESVNRHVQDGTLPDYIADARECRRCPFFGRVCDPGMSFVGDGYVETDQALAEMFGRWSDLESEVGNRVREYDQLTKACKEVVKARTGKRDGMRYYCANVVGATKVNRADQVRVDLEIIEGV